MQQPPYSPIAHPTLMEPPPIVRRPPVRPLGDDADGCECDFVARRLDFDDEHCAYVTHNDDGTMSLIVLKAEVNMIFPVKLIRETGFYSVDKPSEYNPFLYKHVMQRAIPLENTMMTCALKAAAHLIQAEKAWLRHDDPCYEKHRAKMRQALTRLGILVTTHMGRPLILGKAKLSLPLDRL